MVGERWALEVGRSQQQVASTRGQQEAQYRCLKKRLTRDMLSKLKTDERNIISQESIAATVEHYNKSVEELPEIAYYSLLLLRIRQQCLNC